MSQPLYFDKSSCTQQRIDRVRSEIGGNVKFACEPSPYGGNECIVALETSPSSGKTYPATLDGCNQCTAECGVVVGPGGKDEDGKGGHFGGKGNENKQDDKNKVVKPTGFVRKNWLLLLILLVLIIVAIMVLKNKKE